MISPVRKTWRSGKAWRLIGVVDGAIDAVAEAELAREMHHEPSGRELIVGFLDRADQSAAVTAGEDVRDFVLEIEAFLD